MRNKVLKQTRCHSSEDCIQEDTNMRKWWCCRPRILLVIISLVVLLLLVLQFFLYHEKTKSSFVSIKRSAVIDVIKRSHPEATKYKDKSDEIIRVARGIHEMRRPVLVTIINNAYLPFTYSWLCNTMYMGIHKQVLFFTTDMVSKRKLNQDWPAVKVISLAQSDPITGDQAYSRVGYVRMMIRRTEVIFTILQERIEILLFEVDCLWLTNPIPECQKQVQNYDMLGTEISTLPGKIAGGFIYMKPTENLLKLWQRVCEKMLKLESRIQSLSEDTFISEGDNDQVYLAKLVQSQYANIKVKLMSFSEFPDGKWYKLSNAERKQMHPLIINNNWITGNKAKIRRARKFHHWFWKHKSGRCDKKLVNDTVY